MDNLYLVIRENVDTALTVAVTVPIESPDRYSYENICYHKPSYTTDPATLWWIVQAQSENTAIVYAWRFFERPTEFKCWIEDAGKPFPILAFGGRS